MQGVTSSASAHFAGAWKREQERHGRQLLEMLAPAIKRRLADIPAGSALLEVGGGSGLLTVLLLEWGYQVVTLDHNLALLRELENLRHQALAAHYHDFGKPLPYADDSFAAVVSEETLTLLSDEVLGKLLREAHRVLKPNGKLLCAEREPTRMVHAQSAANFSQTVTLTLDYELISVQHHLRSDDCLGAMIADAGFQQPEGEPIRASAQHGTDSAPVEAWLLSGRK